MAGSALTLRLVALAVAAGVLWYIVHLHGEIARLQSEQASSGRTVSQARPPEKAPAAPRAEGKAPDASVAPRTLTEEQRKAMLDKLTSGPTSVANPIWFATIPNNPEAAAFQQAVQKVFEAAGWQVRGNVPVGFSMKAGVYMFSAEEDPPEYVSTVQEALEAGGVTITSSGRGYREYYKQKKEASPNWIGFEMAPDQTFVVAIGRKPDEEPTPQ